MRHGKAYVSFSHHIPTLEANDLAFFDLARGNAPKGSNHSAESFEMKLVGDECGRTEVTTDHSNSIVFSFDVELLDTVERQHVFGESMREVYLYRLTKK